MPAVDVLLVSLGSTAGLREADAELAASLRRAGATVAEVRVAAPRPVRTMALTEATWAWAARRAADAAPAARAVVYSSSTAALLWPHPGAIRFDAPAAGNRPGRHGLWQRAVEARRFASAPLLLPWSAGALDEAPRRHAEAIVLPVPVAPSEPDRSGAGPSPHAAVAVGGGSVVTRDIAAITYGANPRKKGLDRVLAAWARARRGDETLVVAGLARADAAGALGAAAGAPGVEYAGLLPRAEYRALLRRARAFVTAPRREDHGIAQLEALADGCALVTTPAPGPYAALPLARALDPRLVAGDLVPALRAALDDPVDGYADRAREALAPLAPAAVDRLVADRVLPALLARGGQDLAGRAPRR